MSEQKEMEWKHGTPYQLDDSKEYDEALDRFLDFMHNESGIAPEKLAKAYALACGVVHTSRRSHFLAGFWNGVCFWANQRKYFDENPAVWQELERAMSHGDRYTIVRMPGDVYRLRCDTETVAGRRIIDLVDIDMKDLDTSQ